MFFERIIWPGLVVGLAWARPTWQVLVAPTYQRGGGTHLAGSSGTRLSAWGRDPPGRSVGGTHWQVSGQDPPGRLVGGTYFAGQGMGPTWQAGWRNQPGRPVGRTHLSAQGRDPPGRSWAAVVQDPPVSSVQDPPGRSVGRTHLAGHG
jgi:hypothetical protein